ncbi:MAG: AAA family ATPase [Methanomassiliicoccaceae archaeon]|nr:AAA family ATPase [Methanomassiliicoccaceae archaeon]
MIIESVRIRLFGKTANKDYGQMFPGLTVYYGENESGKTTLKEFIRTTLFKTATRKNNYPLTMSTDSGEVDCITDSGEKFTITRAGNKIVSSIGKMPPEISGVDPDVYRSVYAMNPDDLIDTAVVDSGDIKRKFLTVPGGENMPQISESIDCEMEALLNQSKITDSRGIGKLRREIDENAKAIDLARLKGPEYCRLAKDEAEIISELAVLREKQAEGEKVRARIRAYGEQKKNMLEYGELELSRNVMGDADRAPPEGMAKYRELRDSVGFRLAKKEDAEKKLDEIGEKLGGASFDAVERNRARILSLNENIGSYRSAASDMRAIGEEVSILDSDIASLMDGRLDEDTARNADTGQDVIDRASDTRMPKKNNVPAIVLLALAAVSAVAAFVTAVPYIYVVAAVFAVLAAVTVLRSVKPAADLFDDYIVSRGFPPGTRREEVAGLCSVIDSIRRLEEKRQSYIGRVRDMEASINGLDSELASVASEVGIERVSFEADVRMLNALVASLSGITDAAKTAESARSEYLDARAVLDGYLAPYGSAEELERIVKLKIERDRTDERMDNIKTILGSAGIDMVSEPPPLPDDLTAEIGEKQINLGKISNQKAAILRDSDTERLYNERSSLETELCSEKRRWGVLSLEKHISDAACDDIYDNMQPRVIQTADRYLEMMTKGIYRMDGNPRTKNVSIRSGTEIKSKDQWSSGLAGQVCLSLKLAVAKEMSDEKLPILLDDVLLVFDSERKLGACRALSEVAKDMQIIFFTCDRETYGFMKQVGAKTVEISL